jgi:hypothetical protein
MPQAPTPDSSLQTPQRPDRATIDRLNELITRTSKPDHDPADLRELKTTLAKYPAIYRDYGNLAPLIHTRIANAINAKPLIRESILLTANDLRAELTDPTDTPLQKFVVEQCITHYLLHSVTELYYIKEGFATYTTLWDARLESSQKRFLRALETLARLRQAPTTAMQINIAESQTNIVSPNPNTPPSDPDPTDPP